MAAAHSFCGRSCPTDTPRLPQASSENPDGLRTKCLCFCVAVPKSLQFVTVRPPTDNPGITAEGGTGAGSTTQVRGMMLVRCTKSSSPNSLRQKGARAGWCSSANADFSSSAGLYGGVMETHSFLTAY